MPSKDLISSPGTSKAASYVIPENIINYSKSNNSDHASFTRDLLRQFDKRRSLLHVELGFVSSQESSPEPSLASFPAPPLIPTAEAANTSLQSTVTSRETEGPILLDDQPDEEESLKRHGSTVSKQRRRKLSRSRKAASSIVSSSNLSSNSRQYGNIGNNNVDQNTASLLRKSSAFLKSKFDLFKKRQAQTTTVPREGKGGGGEEGENSTHMITPDNSGMNHTVTMTKLCMQTTITIPPKKSQLKKSNSRKGQQVQQELSHAQLLQQLPITSLPKISQYPPKPLVYSSPTIQDQEQTPQLQRTLLHRISMPLLSSDPFNKKSLTRHKNKSMTSLHSALKKRRKSVPK